MQVVTEKYLLFVGLLAASTGWLRQIIHLPLLTKIFCRISRGNFQVGSQPLSLKTIILFCKAVKDDLPAPVWSPVV
jgi:hypothetical protein